MASPIKNDKNNGGLSGCTNEYEGRKSRNRRKTYHRLTSQQFEHLEGFYKECSHPNGKQQHLLGTQLGLDPKQVKYWFQNKRTQAKVQMARSNIKSLRTKNDRIRSGKAEIQKAPQDTSSCSVETDQNMHLQNMEEKNTKLTNEIDRRHNFIAEGKGKGVAIETSDLSEVRPPCSNSGSPRSCLMENANLESEKLVMAKTAAIAIDELIKLMSVEQPMWIKCSNEQESALDYDFYSKVFPESTAKLGCFNSRVEASKYTDVVAIGARFLVDLCLDPGKWVDLFPTVFSKARILSVLDAGLLENRSGSLQLVYQQMHALSPFIRPREFNLLQLCQQIATGVWVIVVVSYDCCVGCCQSSYSSTWCWKHPSGCVIQELLDGFSKVTCVEHVEFDSNIQFHPTSEILLQNALDFGAKRWVMALQETCLIHCYLNAAVTPGHFLNPGRKNMIMLARRMIKNFCSKFHLYGTIDLHQLPKVQGKRIKIVILKNTVLDRHFGNIICAGSSFWVPVSPVEVIGYLSDYKIRCQWDGLCNGSPMSEISNLPIGSYSMTNAISILKPLNPDASPITIFQESIVRPSSSESLIVYAPIAEREMFRVAAGMDSSNVPILASGFAITPRGHAATAKFLSGSNSSGSRGTIVNLAFQILLCKSSNAAENVGDEALAMADALVSRAIRVIQAAFGMPT